MRRNDLAATAGATAAVIKAINAGTMKASAATLHRLEGAYTVLDLLASGETRPDHVLAHLAPDI